MVIETKLISAEEYQALKEENEKLKEEIETYSFTDKALTERTAELLQQRDKLVKALDRAVEILQIVYSAIDDEEVENYLEETEQLLQKVKE